LTLIEGAAISSSTAGERAGGTLRVSAQDSITLGGGSTESGLFATTTTAARGGDIFVHAPRITLQPQGAIRASSTGMGDAGTITLQAAEVFRSQRGLVTTEAAQAGGGNIQLLTGKLV